MADVTIPGLTTQLTSVDRAADLLEVSDTSDSGNSKKSSVNNLLDLTSHPVGIDDVQTLTNKTITAPTVSSPVLSGTVTGTYTLGGTPTFPSAVVTLTGNQTLTNKVLTSPTINAPTITNPTITVDAISEFTATNGVTVDGLNIKDSALNTANSVPNSALSNTGVFGSAWAWTSWTPTLSGRLNDSKWTKNCKYVQIGKTVFFRLYLLANAATPMDGGTAEAIVSLPTTSISYPGGTGTDIIGTARMVAGGAATIGYVEWKTTTTMQVRAMNANSTYVGTTVITSTVPGTWASTDAIWINGFYEAA